jgi:hypothetical protein
LLFRGLHVSYRRYIRSLSLLALTLALDRGAPGGESGGDDPTLLVNLVLLSNES